MEGLLVRPLRGHLTLYSRIDRAQLEAKESAMYLSVGVVVAIVLVLASPIIWVSWWLLADFSERGNGSYRAEHTVATGQSRHRAA